MRGESALDEDRRWIRGRLAGCAAADGDGRGVRRRAGHVRHVVDQRNLGDLPVFVHHPPGRADRV
jgi:hypothetical protein